MAEFKRPDHPDFWLISEVLVYGDAARDNNTVPFDDHVNQVVDLKSVQYAAEQQAGMFIQQLGGLPAVISTKRVEIMLAAAWMTAFQYGVRFAELRRSKDPTVAGLVVTIYNAPGDEGVAYTLRLPDGTEAVISEAAPEGGQTYAELAGIIDDAFEKGETNDSTT